MRSELIDLVCVDPKRVHEFWPVAGPMLKTAVLRTNLAAWQDIEYDILYGDALLWLVWSGKIEAVVSTGLYETDAGKVCVITALAGENMSRWLQLISKIETYAKDEGCKCVRIYGRKGWARVLDGYLEKNVILDKELN